MADPKLVGEVISPVAQLDPDATVAEAVETLDRAGAAFGVVSGARGELLALVTAEQLRAGHSGGQRLQMLVADAPRPIVVEPRVTLDSVIQRLTKDLVLQPGLAGIVVQERDHLKGVVPRDEIVEYASRTAKRGIADRLEGAPVDVLLYECEIDHERKLVAYYDPKNPPRCSAGHLMKPVEE
jgi:CBS domain-containing protein